MKTRFPALLIFLVAGIFCVLAAYWVLQRLATPDLCLELVRKDESTIAVRFINPGREPVKLDLAGMTFFVVPPFSASEPYVLQICNRPYYGTPREVSLRERECVTLPPGEWSDRGNIVPFLKHVSAKKIRVSAVYIASGENVFPPDCWYGVAKSPALTVELQ